MNTIRYAKYSRDRSPRFQIRTAVFQEAGHKWVEKAPLTPAAAAHVQKLSRSYEILRGQYEDTQLKICPCRMQNGTALFDFIEGETLTGVLRKLVESGDEEGTTRLCLSLAKLICSCKGLHAFKKTQPFLEVFGDIALPDGLRAGDYSNIDMITDNFILSGQILTLLDYEWCFDFPIPIEYTLFRMFYFTFEKWNDEEYVTQTLCPLLGISESAVAAFQKMEEAFRDHVYRDAFRIEDAYYSMRGVTYPFAMLHDAGQNQGQLMQRVEESAQMIGAISKEKTELEETLAAVCKEKADTEEALAAVRREKADTEEKLAAVSVKKNEMEMYLAAARQEQCEEHRQHMELLSQHESCRSELAVFKNELEARRQYLAQHRIKAAVKAILGMLWQE